MALKLSGFHRKTSTTQNKYKNLLISVLSPSKKCSKQRKHSDSHSFREIKTSSIEEKKDKSQILSSFQDINYAGIQKNSSQNCSSASDPEKVASSHSETHCEKFSIDTHPKLINEPLYASITKKPVQDVMPKVPKKFVTDIHFEEKGNNIKSEVCENGSKEILKSSISKREKGREDQSKSEKIKILQERLKESSEENKSLRKHLENLLKEEKLKEDTVHANFQLKLTELEAETRKDVKCLTERIQILAREREILSEQVHTLHQEKKALHLKIDLLCKKAKTMITVELHEKAIEEQKKLINDYKLRYQTEKLQTKEKYNVLEEKNQFLMIQLKELEETKKILQEKNNTLKSVELNSLQEQNRIILQLKESKQLEKEAQALLQSLLKAVENIVNERDALLNKTYFQDQLQKMMQSTVIGYSVNIGRLQEHIASLSTEKSEESKQFKMQSPLDVENIKQSYEQQIDFLRSKILNQNNTLQEQENAKRILESQLESIWQAVCVGKPKLADEDSNLKFLNT